MGNLLGVAAGLLMIVLILALLFKFIADIGVKFNSDIVKSVKKYTLWGFCFFVVMYITAGILYTFMNPDGTIVEGVYEFSVERVWDFALYTGYRGMPSLYNLLLKGFSAILFGQTVRCGMYISLICAAITCVSFALAIKKTADETVADKCFVLLLATPFSYLIFMSAPYSMFIAMFALFTVLIVYEKKWLALIPCIVGACTHIYGIILIVLWLLFMWVFNNSKYIYEIIAVTTWVCQIILLAFCVMKGWETIEEMVFTMILPVIMVNSRYKLLFKGDTYKLTVTAVMLLNGFIICKYVL